MRCARCGRPLRSAESKKAGLGKRCKFLLKRQGLEDVHPDQMNIYDFIEGDKEDGKKTSIQKLSVGYHDAGFC